MQSIRRATRKHRKVLLGVVIVLMLGLVGSFATWGAAGNVGGADGSVAGTIAQQIAAYQTYINNMLEENSEPDYATSLTLANAYMDLNELYRNKASEDITAAREAANAAAAEAEANGEEAPEAVDTSAAGEEAEAAALHAAEQAQVYYQRAWDVAPAELNNAGLADIKYSLAASREMQNDLEGALAFITEAYDLNPDNVQYILARGALLQNLGRVEEALPIYEQGAEKYPDNTQIMIARAALIAQGGELEEARTLYLRARELAPEDVSVAYAYASYIFNYENAEAGVAEMQAFRDSLPEGHAAIAEADYRISNLTTLAQIFANMNFSDEEAGDEEAAGEEEAAE